MESAMPRILKPLLTAVIALFPLAAVAAPAYPPPSAPSHAAIAQAGWWEEEHREGTFRDRYWHLSPEQRAHYDRLEFQIHRDQERLSHEAREGDRREYYQVSAQIEQMRREQYRILHFWE
jgi:hypothetical protein